MEKNLKCPICGERHERLVHQFHQDVDAPIVSILAEEAPANWQPAVGGACTRCIDQAQLELQLKALAGSGDPAEVNGYKILPTPTRLMAVPDLTGKGVTICFIDSGFYFHPDLIYPKNRILKILDITKPDRGEDYFSQPHNSSWHGTMTSVVCAGNGFLSNGMYRGIASEANLVLLKVTDDEGKIHEENITKALEWAIENRKEYGIKIINLSVTGDDNVSHEKNKLDRAVEKAVKKGISVVAAAGNAPNAPILPPANSPHAITVGGLDDRNTLDPLLNTLYHSTFGKTIDQFQKPDIIAPAIWVAAPILPKTKEQREAEAFFNIYQAGGKAIHAVLANLIRRTSLDIGLLSQDEGKIREAIEKLIGERKYISPHYQHADGTSFAAPIVCSVIAQMLEANPALDPYTIREILFVTARKLPGEDAERQGWGVIRPEHAVQMASGKKLQVYPDITPVIDYRNMEVSFYLHHDVAKEVVVAGDFNDWDEMDLPLEMAEGGKWEAKFSFGQKGVYRYKFLVNKSDWINDPRNLFQEEDGFNGFNSKLIIF
ncbi:MAG: S8 family serine peptidase [Saprospiraceae bacterium]|nr:S8 family serine peptidase [Saprospiraceae bacterium]